VTTKRVMPAVLSASDVHTPRGGQDLAWVSRARLLFIEDGGWCGVRVGPESARLRVFFSVEFNRTDQRKIFRL